MTLTVVTGFPRIKSDIPITKRRFDALATAYVRGETRDITLNAKTFWSQFRAPSAKRRVRVL